MGEGQEEAPEQSRRAARGTHGVLAVESGEQPEAGVAGLIGVREARPEGGGVLSGKRLRTRERAGVAARGPAWGAWPGVAPDEAAGDRERAGARRRGGAGARGAALRPGPRAETRESGVRIGDVGELLLVVVEASSEEAGSGADAFVLQEGCRLSRHRSVGGRAEWDRLA